MRTFLRGLCALLAVAFLAGVGSCATPLPYRTDAVQRALAIDPIMRWRCPNPYGPVYVNTEGYDNMTPKDRARCVRITPTHL